jgi:hypothetical protein
LKKARLLTARDTRRVTKFEAKPHRRSRPYGWNEGLVDSLVYDAPDPSEGRVLSYVAALREALDPALGADPAISPSDDFYEVYRFILPGYNARPLEVAGAVGVEQLEKLDRILSIRRHNASLFRSLFEDATSASSSSGR